MTRQDINSLYSITKIMLITCDLRREKAQMLAKCVQKFDIDLSKPFNVQFSEGKLTDEEISDIALKYHKRADGQYIYNGELISMFKLSELIAKRFIKITMRLQQAKTIDAPVVMWQGGESD